MKKITNKINNLKQSELINTVKTKVRRTIASRDPILRPYLNSIFKFLVRIFKIDRIDPKILAFLIMLFKIIFKGGLYINITVAVLVFLSHALDLEYKLSWELFTYLIPALVIAFNSYLTDLWGRITSFLKWILEKFVSNLKEVKETVEHDVERVVNTVTQTESDPKPKENWKYYKYGLYTLGALAILCGSYYYWDEVTKPILMSPWYALKWCYRKVRGKRPNTQQPRGPYEPDYAGLERDLEMNKVPSSTSAVETSKSGFFSIFNRSNKGKGKLDPSIDVNKSNETIFSVGEYTDPFSGISNSTTPTPSTPKVSGKLGSPSRSYFQYDNSLLNTNNSNKNK